jgi:hypothetical protein
MRKEVRRAAKESGDPLVMILVRLSVREAVRGRKMVPRESYSDAIKRLLEATA